MAACHSTPFVPTLTTAPLKRRRPSVESALSAGSTRARLCPRATQAQILRSWMTLLRQQQIATTADAAIVAVVAVKVDLADVAAKVAAQAAKVAVAVRVDVAVDRVDRAVAAKVDVAVDRVDRAVAAKVAARPEEAAADALPQAS